MHVVSSAGSYRRLLAAWLLALAAVSPAAAGPVELSVASQQRQVPRLVTASSDAPKAAIEKSEAERRAAMAKRDPRLNDDLAAFSRAF